MKKHTTSTAIPTHALKAEVDRLAAHAEALAPSAHEQGVTMTLHRNSVTENPAASERSLHMRDSRS